MLKPDLQILLEGGHEEVEQAGGSAPVFWWVGCGAGLGYFFQQLFPELFRLVCNIEQLKKLDAYLLDEKRHFKIDSVFSVTFYVHYPKYKFYKETGNLATDDRRGEGSGNANRQRQIRAKAIPRE